MTEITKSPSEASASAPASPSRPYSSRPPSSGPYKGRPSGPGGPGGRNKLVPRRRLCRICMEKRGGVDWKAVNFLRNFVTERGKILSGRTTGTCSRCQRQLTRAIKRARNLALLPTSPV